MKTIVRQLPPQEKLAALSDATDSRYYGVVIAGFKGFITNVNGYYWAMCATNITNGNMWGTVSDRRLDNVLSNILTMSGKAYEFDSYEELFKWLSE